MMKPITGQYECEHKSGVGLDYFTSRLDRLVLQPDGRFILTIQDRSRLANAAQSLLAGQQATMAVKETRREGRYTQRGNELSLYFDGGGFEPGKIAWNGEGVQLGPNFFKKVSDSTLLPSAHRLQKDMDDIAKGLKIAGTLGGMAIKAVKTIQGTMQTIQGTASPSPATGGQPSPASAPGQAPAGPSPAQPAAPPAAPSAAQPRQAPQTPAPSSTPPRPMTTSAQPLPPEDAVAASQGYTEALFCDQCGARVRPGKRFCNNCGARLA
ncbi:MAG: zinc ribbon domain-containing protein [Ktedonobacteraceae bacterium]|nr:zinc ribbon domain-containing protein [Ktedonobacteraceae bacterium]